MHWLGTPSERRMVLRCFRLVRYRDEVAEIRESLVEDLPMPRTLVLVSCACILFASATASAQCSKDTDCKGDRLCVSGKCVFPGEAKKARPGGHVKAKRLNMDVYRDGALQFVIPHEENGTPQPCRFVGNACDSSKISGIKTPMVYAIESAKYGDLNGDGKEDLVVLESYSCGDRNKCGSVGGNTLLVFEQRPDSPSKHGDATPIVYFKDHWILEAWVGDFFFREAVGGGAKPIGDYAIKKGALVVTTLKHGPNDPRCCPTLKTTKKYRLGKDGLKQAR